MIRELGINSFIRAIIRASDQELDYTTSRYIHQEFTLVSTQSFFRSALKHLWNFNPGFKSITALALFEAIDLWMQ